MLPDKVSSTERSDMSAHSKSPSSAYMHQGRRRSLKVLEFNFPDLKALKVRSP
jgi:hypothetical protein